MILREKCKFKYLSVIMIVHTSMAHVYYNIIYRSGAVDDDVCARCSSRRKNIAPSWYARYARYYRGTFICCVALCVYVCSCNNSGRYSLGKKKQILVSTRTTRKSITQTSSKWPKRRAICLSDYH